MTDKQWAQIEAQLPEGAKILRTYRAIEGDMRVIVSIPGDAVTEQRYTVAFVEDGYPAIKLMP